jgi:hypothetical protein
MLSYFSKARLAAMMALFLAATLDIAIENTAIALAGPAAPVWMLVRMMQFSRRRCENQQFDAYSIKDKQAPAG